MMHFLEGGKYREIRPGSLTAALDCPRCGAELIVSAERVRLAPGCRDPRQTTIDGIVRCGCGWDVEIRGGMCYERDLDPWDNRIPTNESRAKRQRRPLSFESMNYLSR